MNKLHHHNHVSSSRLCVRFWRRLCLSNEICRKENTRTAARVCHPGLNWTGRSDTRRPFDGSTLYLAITTRKLELSSFIHNKWLTGAERKQAETHFSSVCPSFNYRNALSSHFLFYEFNLFQKGNIAFFSFSFCNAKVATGHWKGTTSILIWIYISFIISTA